MTAITLSPSSRRELRAQAHHLHPLVRISGDGLQPSILNEIDRCLLAHELIKIRVFGDDAELRKSYMEEICDQLDAAPVQRIGKLLLIYRPKPAETSPENSKPATRSKVSRSRTTKLRLASNQRLSDGGKVKRRRKRQVSTKKNAD